MSLAARAQIVCFKSISFFDRVDLRPWLERMSLAALTMVCRSTRKTKIRCLWPVSMRTCLSCHSHLWKIHSHSTRVRLSGSPTSEVQESACETRLSQTALLCMTNKTFPTPMLFSICSNKNGLCLDINMKHTDALVATVFNLSRRADQQKPSLHWSVLVLELTFIWLWSWRWATVSTWMHRPRAL